LVEALQLQRFDHKILAIFYIKQKSFYHPAFKKPVRHYSIAISLSMYTYEREDRLPGQ
jgi:hypothetical protein